MTCGALGERNALASSSEPCFIPVSTRGRSMGLCAHAHAKSGPRFRIGRVRFKRFSHEVT